MFPLHIYAKHYYNFINAYIAERKIVMEIDRYVFEKVKRGMGTEKENLDVVSVDGSYLAYIKEPSDKIKKTAVIQNGYALQFIDKPSDDLISIAIVASPSNAAYVKKPTRHQIDLMLSIDPMTIKYIKSGIEKSDWVKCLKKNPQLMRYIPRTILTKDLCLVAGLEDYSVIRHMPQALIDTSLAKAFVNNNGMAIQYLSPDVVTDEIKILAVEQDYHAAKYIIDMSDKALKRLVQLIDDNKKIIDYLTPSIIRGVCLIYRERYIDSVGF